MKANKNKVLLIGWDAADWKYLSPLMDEGVMPNLTTLVNGGMKGKLATLDPPLSPTLWTSIATGKRPYKHGIHGFTEADPSGKGIRPINNTNRKVKAIWNILTQNDYKSNVIGWWPSHPAEPINGVMVSNFFQKASYEISKPWPLANGTVSPASYGEVLKKLRVHPEELTSAHVLPFVPNAHIIDQSVDSRLKTLTNITAECSSIQSAATYLMEHEDWDFTAVYFDAIDHYCHAFMKFHPPHRSHIPMKDFETYKDVVRGGCIYHDMMLGRLIELAGKDTTIMLISDHGFHPDHNRPKSIPQEPSGPAIEHSPYGIIVVKGPEIKEDGLIFGASLLDITPTILSIFGLPVASDMDGKVLSQIFKDEINPVKINSWEDVKGFDGSHQGDIIQTQIELENELQQLIDLGYIADPGNDIQKAIQETEKENNFYLARSFFDGREWEAGIMLLEELHKNDPNIERFAIYLMQGYLATNKFKLARKILDGIKTVQVAERPTIDVLEGTLLIAEKRYKKAIQLFEKIEDEVGNLPGLQQRIAVAYLKINQVSKAQKIVLKAIEQDPENVTAHFTLGQCYFKTASYENALSSFLDAIGLMYYFPAAHFYLGETFLAMAQYNEAAEAFKTCLRLAPAMNLARQKLMTIYSKFLNEPGKVLQYQAEFEDKLNGEITIVSGLPRSGTSMMMQMLEAGGAEIFTDQQRQPDENNTMGYYEHEGVKNLAKDNTFLEKANGKTVKVIAQLLPYLPMKYKYKVIFMERNLTEIIRSQQVMLSRLGKNVKKEVLPLKLYEDYQKTINNVKAWAEQKPNIEIIFQRYDEIVEQPFIHAIEISEFLDDRVNPQKMIMPVNSKLYRERSQSVPIS